MPDISGRILTPSTAGRQPEPTDFRVFWFGQALAQLGGRSATVALPLLAVVAFDATPGEVGLVNAAQSIPVFVATLAAGVWVDRTSRRRNLTVAHTLRAACLLALATASLMGWSPLSLLCAVGFLLGALGALADVAGQALLPSLVPTDRLLRSNTRIETTTALAQVAAPGISGLLVNAIAGVGAVWPLALGLLAAGASLRLIQAREPHPTRTAAEPDQTPRAAFRTVTHGIRFVAGNRLLRLLVVQAAWFNLFEQAVLTLYLVYGIRTLHLSSGLVGLAMTLGALGTFLGSFAVRRLQRRLGVMRSLIVSIGAASLAPIVLPLAAGPVPVTVLLCALSFVVYGFGLTVFNVFSVSIRQHAAPQALLGQVTAAFRAVAFGTIWMGAVLGGAAGQYLGLRAGLFAAAAALVAGWLVCSLLLRRCDTSAPHLTASLAGDPQ
ncbi:MFS transporter [Streptomyces sp. NPDC093707]|uniref:MFS transporter n=1 Tax=Streptomyces sp. NPDC093707 TaxID=3154984 RepID=UPI00344EE881